MLRELYPNLVSLVNDGCTLELNGYAGKIRICSICTKHEFIAVFRKGTRMTMEQMLARLELYAKEYLEEGWINDGLNGERYQIDD